MTKCTGRVNPIENFSSPEDVAKRMSSMIPGDDNYHHNLKAHTNRSFHKLATQMIRDITQKTGQIVDMDELASNSLSKIHQQEIEENKSREGKYTLTHNTIFGSCIDLQTESLDELLLRISQIESKLGYSVLDDDYMLELPDGDQLWQTSILRWYKEKGLRS